MTVSLSSPLSLLKLLNHSRENNMSDSEFLFISTAVAVCEKFSNTFDFNRYFLCFKVIFVGMKLPFKKQALKTCFY